MNKTEKSVTQVLESLYNPRTIRRQSHRVLELAKHNQLKHFHFHQEQMQATAAFVIEVILDQYPDLDIPYHSRWRHFEAGGVNRIQKILASLKNNSLVEQGKILYELVIISVLLDAGAGPCWSYLESETGKPYTRSEGLALASLSLYQHGILSSIPQEPLRIDAQRLIDFREEDLQHAFQITTENPLAGVAGRVRLMNQLGAAIKENPGLFGSDGRLGDFYTYICSLERDNSISVLSIFQAVLNAFNSIWPKRLDYHGVSLGDVWIHPSLKNTEEGSEYIPFHKLSQWLTYSLIEPLEQAGIAVNDMEQLTGLPEYRNGGLLVDSGLLSIKNPEMLMKAHEPGSKLVVEWRALTVALLDKLADQIRKELQQDASSLPLAKILQGGTWEAGRRIARQHRARGTPPLEIISDGTVF